MRMKEFHAFINKVWDKVLEMSEKNKLVNVFIDRIEAIN